MTLLKNCSTPVAYLLVACPDDNGVLRFPVAESELPGLPLEVDLQKPINEQLLDAAKKASLSARDVDIRQDVALPLFLNDGRHATLYLARLNRSGGSDSWPKLPDILRALPSNRNRNSYLKAIQVFASGLNDSLRVVASEHLLQDE